MMKRMITFAAACMLVFSLACTALGDALFAQALEPYSNQMVENVGYTDQDGGQLRYYLASDSDGEGWAWDYYRYLCLQNSFVPLGAYAMDDWIYLCVGAAYNASLYNTLRQYGSGGAYTPYSIIIIGYMTNGGALIHVRSTASVSLLDLGGRSARGTGAGTPTATPWRVTPPPVTPRPVTPRPATPRPTQKPATPKPGASKDRMVQEPVTWANDSVTYEFDSNKNGYLQKCYKTRQGAAESTALAYADMLGTLPNLTYNKTVASGEWTHICFGAESGLKLSTFRLTSYGEKITPSSVVIVSYQTAGTRNIYVRYSTDLELVDLGYRMQ